MEIHFDKEYLQQLYEEGKTKDKKYRFQPQMVKRYQLRIKTLEYVQNIEELYAIRSFHYEVLKGDKAGISSIREENQEIYRAHVGPAYLRFCYCRLFPSPQYGNQRY